MMNNQNMNIRTSLKNLFKDGTFPTSDDFNQLIDAVLLKRDDQFFGKWMPGISYKTDDIVIFNQAFYIYLPADHAADCDCDDDCCSKSPEECCRWQTLQLCADTERQDCSWVKYDEHTLYAEVFGKVGIGTGSAPKAFLHLHDAHHHSHLMFNPLDCEEQPLLKMTREVPPSTAASKYGDSEEEGWSGQTHHNKGQSLFVSQQLESTIQTAHSDPVYRTTCRTNTLGYLFKRQVSAESAGYPNQEELALLFVTSTPDRPRVGIGTTHPEGALDIKEHGRGQIILEPGEYKSPQILLVNLHPGDPKSYLKFKISKNWASFASNAPCGFAFRQGVAYPAGHDTKYSAPPEIEKNLAVIDGEGNLRAHGIYVEPISHEGGHIHEALRILCELQPRRHRDGNDRQYGFSAENIREVLPHACKNFPDDSEGIAYHDLVVLLVKSLQELVVEVEQLKKRVRNYE